VTALPKSVQLDAIIGDRVHAYLDGDWSRARQLGDVPRVV
jgi:hypothetical protein